MSQVGGTRVWFRKKYIFLPTQVYRYRHCADNDVSINTVPLTSHKSNAKKQTCFRFVYKVRPVS